MRLVDLTGHLSSKSSILNEVNPVAFAGFAAVWAWKILGSSGQVFEPQGRSPNSDTRIVLVGSWEDLERGGFSGLNIEKP